MMDRNGVHPNPAKDKAIQKVSVLKNVMCQFLSVVNQLHLTLQKKTDHFGNSSERREHGCGAYWWPGLTVQLGELVRSVTRKSLNNHSISATRTDLLEC